MDVLVDFRGPWGLGDLLCADPMLLGLTELHGPDTRIWLNGKVGNLIHNPLVSGMARVDQRFGRVVEVRLFSEMPLEEYARLEAMPSLIDHMCSYAGVTPSDRRPRLHLRPDDLAACRRLPPKRRPRVAICADHVDPLRHWPVERWRRIASALHDAGAEVVGVGLRDDLGCGLDFVGRLSMRETAAVLSSCDLFAGNNSGPFHYAQAAAVPCVTLFSVATPARFIHPGCEVHAVEADGLPCLHCMSRCFVAMQQTGCTAAPRGRCMTDITPHRVLDAIDVALQALEPRAATARRAAPC